MTPSLASKFGVHHGGSHQLIVETAACISNGHPECSSISIACSSRQGKSAPSCAGGLCLPETPNSLVERGYLSEARYVLQKVRGTKDVDVEFDTIVLANEALKGMENPWRAIFRRRNRPQLILAIAMPFFQ